MPPGRLNQGRVIKGTAPCEDPPSGQFSSGPRLSEKPAIPPRGNPDNGIHKWLAREFSWRPIMPINAHLLIAPKRGITQGKA
ncbi:hypothetical protein EV286_1039 [Rhizobium sp. BK251]|nr:hypothetical protein EV286_1039 [Rhizobium sp. BK251]